MDDLMRLLYPEEALNQELTDQQIEERRRRFHALVCAYRMIPQPVIDDLAWRCFRDRPTHVRGDPYETAHNEGARQVILHIEAMRGFDPNQLEERTNAADHRQS